MVVISLDIYPGSYPVCQAFEVSWDCSRVVIFPHCAFYKDIHCISLVLSLGGPG